MADAAQAASAEDTSDDINYKLDTLIVLSNSTHQRLLASNLAIFRAVWTEHKQYTVAATSPGQSLVFARRWACLDHIVRELVVPTLEAAFSTGTEAGSLRRLGLTVPVSVPAWPQALGFQVEDIEEDQTVLLAHVQLAFSATFQILIYSFLPQTPPWRFVGLITPGLVEETLAFLKSVWELKTFLQQSANPAHHVLILDMPYLEWPAVTEVCELLSMAAWTAEGPWAEKAFAVVHSIFSGASAFVVRNRDSPGGSRGMKASCDLLGSWVDIWDRRMAEGLFGWDRGPE